MQSSTSEHIMGMTRGWMAPTISSWQGSIGILKLFYLLDCQSVLAFFASSISKDTLGVHSVHISIVKGHMNKVSHMWIFAFTPQLMRCGGPKGTAKCSCRGRGRNVGSTAAPKVVFAPSVRPPVLLVEKHLDRIGRDSVSRMQH